VDRLLDAFRGYHLGFLRHVWSRQHLEATGVAHEELGNELVGDAV
jgi:hypothetical protein